MTLLVAALALALQADMPKATYSPDFEPLVKAAKTLSCGMTRGDVKVAFKDVRPPDTKDTFMTEGLEEILWEEKETTSGGFRYCAISVLLHSSDLAGPSSLHSVVVFCASTSEPDRWGERTQAQNRFFRLECEKGARARPAQRTGPGQQAQPAPR